jgi:iron complex transport system substrate-binding protein
MRSAVALLAAGAILASGAWTAALPPPPVTGQGLAASAVADGAFPKEVVDPLGHRMMLQARPQRIVSLALADDEILLALVPPARLAGLTYLVDDRGSTPSAGLAPPSAARVTEENPEQLLALRPDLVVSAGYTHAEAIATLEAAGVAVVGTGAHATLDDVLAAVRRVGQAVGEAEGAGALETSLARRIAAVEARGRRGQKVRVLVWEDGFTYGRGTMPEDVLRRAGALDVATEAGLAGAVALTEEAVVALAPDVVIVPTGDEAPRPHAPELLGSAPVWRAVAAVRCGEVYGLPRAWVGSVSLPAVQALEAVADILGSRGPS